MKKYLLIFTVMLFILNCSPTINNNYSGYIYCDTKPLKGIKIIEQNSQNYTYSNEKGYFCLKRKDLNSINDLIMLEEGKKDVIKILRGGSAGSNFHYLFLNDNSDTLDLCQERIFNK